MKNAARIFVLLILATAPRAFADTLTLPLEGYFHPGRAMPVQWNLSPALPGRVELSADRAVGSRVQVSDSSHGVFPWLTLDAGVKNIHWSTPTGTGTELKPPLHNLDASDRLIGSASENSSLPTDLFPGNSKVVIPLDPLHPIEGPAMAWESLDALILEPRSYTAVPLLTRQELVAEGVTLAVTGDAAPDREFDWRKTGQLWIVSSDLHLPGPENSDAFEPTHGWIAGRSAEFRARIVLLAVVFCLVVSGVGLWRSRLMPLAIVAVSIACGAAFAWDNRRQSPLAFAQGDICVNTGASSFQDRWLYLSSHRDVKLNVPIYGLVRPIVASAAQSERFNLTLIFDGGGEPIGLIGQLTADEPLAIIMRSPAQPSNVSMQNPVTSPLRSLATDSIYPGRTIAGQSPALDWPTVYLHPRR